MREPQPTFPPLLTGHPLVIGKAPAEWATMGAAGGRLGAGDLVWSEDEDDLRLALVLEPEVPRRRCAEIVYVAAVAVGDAVGALCPPEILITYQWPCLILANDAEIGSVDLTLSETDHDGVPDWMVLSLSLHVRPRDGSREPGLEPGRTTLWDEGCGELGRTAFLESVSRHLVNLIHNWSEDGVKPVHDQWWARLAKTQPLMAGAVAPDGDGALLGLDDTGNALIKSGAATKAVATLDALARLRARRGDG